MGMSHVTHIHVTHIHEVYEDRVHGLLLLRVG